MLQKLLAMVRLQVPIGKETLRSRTKPYSIGLGLDLLSSLGFLITLKSIIFPLQFRVSFLKPKFGNDIICNDKASLDLSYVEVL